MSDTGFDKFETALADAREEAEEARLTGKTVVSVLHAYQFPADMASWGQIFSNRMAKHFKAVQKASEVLSKVPGPQKEAAKIAARVAEQNAETYEKLADSYKDFIDSWYGISGLSGKTYSAAKKLVPFSILSTSQLFGAVEGTGESTIEVIDGFGSD
ncbi:MAG: hypothetical protein AAF449_16025, partial [Myxococcota bacterium]